jgi:hypothetical protein
MPKQNFNSIKTTDKDAFLKSEFRFFKAVYENDFDWFVSESEVESCPTCRILYWKNAKKRCECKD